MTAATASDGPTINPLRDKTVRNTALICFIGLGGFLAWAGLAPLAEGVPATGQIVVENDRQVVQHLEGGIIEELLVRDGDHVEAGQPLLTLQETASQAARNEVLLEIAALTASIQRLDALRSNAEAPDFTVLGVFDLTT